MTNDKSVVPVGRRGAPEGRGGAARRERERGVHGTVVDRAAGGCDARDHLDTGLLGGVDRHRFFAVLSFKLPVASSEKTGWPGSPTGNWKPSAVEKLDR